MFLYDQKKPYRVPFEGTPIKVTTINQTWAHFTFGRRLVGSTAFQTEAAVHRARIGRLKQVICCSYLRKHQAEFWSKCEAAYIVAEKHCRQNSHPKITSKR